MFVPKLTDGQTDGPTDNLNTWWHSCPRRRDIRYLSGWVFLLTLGTTTAWTLSQLRWNKSRGSSCECETLTSGRRFTKTGIFSVDIWCVEASDIWSWIFRSRPAFPFQSVPTLWSRSSVMFISSICPEGTRGDQILTACLYLCSDLSQVKTVSRASCLSHSLSNTTSRYMFKHRKWCLALLFCWIKLHSEGKP